MYFVKGKTYQVWYTCFAVEMFRYNAYKEYVCLLCGKECCSYKFYSFLYLIKSDDLKTARQRLQTLILLWYANTKNVFMYIIGSLLLCWEAVVPSSLEGLYCRVASARKTFTYAKEKLSVNIVRRLSLPLRVQSVLTEVNAAPPLGLPHCCVNSVVDTATFDNVFRLLCVLSLYVCTHYLLVCVSSSFYQWNISRHHISIFVLFFTQDVHNGGGSGGMQCVPLLESHLNFEKLAMGGYHEALNTWQDTR